jgi:transcriptional regulator with XRE-family HTH domain
MPKATNPISLKPRANESLPGYVRRLRELRHMTRRQVAEASRSLPPQERLSEPYLSLIERGRILEPGRGKIEGIARTLGVPREYLLPFVGLDITTQAAHPIFLDQSPLSQRMTLIFSRLSPSDQESLLIQAEALLARRTARPVALPHAGRRTAKTGSRPSAKRTVRSPKR